MRLIPIRPIAIVSFALAVLAWSAPGSAQTAPPAKSTKRVVTFDTEDGVTIYGTLHLPAQPRPLMAGAVLLAEPGWILRSTFDSTNVAPDLAEKHGMAVLTIDFRGVANNVRGKRFHHFTSSEVDALRLDVRGAVRFLASQDGVDGRRIGLVGTGLGAEFAVREADANPAVTALVLISGELSDASFDYIRRRRDVPVLCLAGKDDREGLPAMARARSLSGNADSDILLGASGRGTGMFTRTAGLSEAVASWLASNVTGLGVETEVTFDSSDGWRLRGKLRIPAGASPGARVPGVVFVHGAMHDHDTWYELSRALAKKGIASLVFDWRGKNRDITDEKGHYAVNMPGDGSQQIHLDVQAAIRFLTSQGPVDARRMGLVAATLPTTSTLQAAQGQSGIRTIVLLSQYQLNDAARNYLRTSGTPIFFVASTEDVNYAVGSLADFTKEAYRLSNSRESDLVLYDDAGRGSEMLKAKPELHGMIVRWLEEKLKERPAATSSR